MLMSTTANLGKKGFGTGIMLAMLLAAFAAFAQEGPDEQGFDDIGPAVDTSAMGTEASLPTETDATESGVDGLEPAVDTSATRDDISRTTTGNRVMDSMTLGRTEITGNQELPKVLYIVPWKKADPGDLMGRPVNSLLDEILAPVDREEFIRQVNYYDDLYGESEQE
jgi:hypothetical protein